MEWAARCDGRFCQPSPRVAFTGARQGSFAVFAAFGEIAFSCSRSVDGGQFHRRAARLSHRLWQLGTTTSMSPTQQRVVVSKPVFKMKRTGQSTLPRAIPTPGRWSNIPTPTSPHGLYAEPEPAQIVSDILPPQPPSTPTPDAMAAQPKPNSASDSTRKTKYATDEERRKATSLALKRTFTVSLSPC